MSGDWGPTHTRGPRSRSHRRAHDSLTGEELIPHTRKRPPRGGLRGMDVGSRHCLYYLKQAGASEQELEQARVARWRLKNGLEHRTLVALLHAPEVIPEARRTISPADFLTPAYAALAAVILDAPEGAPEVARARAAIAGRAYLPNTEAFDWRVAAVAGVAALGERRERWTAKMVVSRRVGISSGLAQNDNTRRDGSA